MNVPAPFDEDDENTLSTVDLGTTLAYLFTLHAIPVEPAAARSDVQRPLTAYYLPALALYTKLLWYISLPRSDLQAKLRQSPEYNNGHLLNPS